MLISMQWALDRISAWVKEAGLELSPAKSVAVVFSRCDDSIDFFEDEEIGHRLQVDGVELQWQKEARYLGVFLDQRLNFRSHIERKVKAARMTIMRLKGSMGKLWGPSPYLTRWAYLCEVRQALTFGHFVWGSLVTTKRLRGKHVALQAEAF